MLLAALFCELGLDPKPVSDVFAAPGAVGGAVVGTDSIGAAVACATLFGPAVIGAAVFRAALTVGIASDPDSDSEAGRCQGTLLLASVTWSQLCTTKTVYPSSLGLMEISPLCACGRSAQNQKQQWRHCDETTFGAL